MVHAWCCARSSYIFIPSPVSSVVCGLVMRRQGRESKKHTIIAKEDEQKQVRSVCRKKDYSLWICTISCGLGRPVCISPACRLLSIQETFHGALPHFPASSLPSGLSEAGGAFARLNALLSFLLPYLNY